MSNTVSNGKVVSLEYTLTLEGGEVVDSNVGANPITYTQGANQIIRGVEAAVEGMEIGQAKQAVVPATEAYGDSDPNAFAEVPKEKLPKEIDGDVIARVNKTLRINTEANHSATHLLHAALRQVLGTHVAQKGSLVNNEHLRFDFSHFAKVTDAEIAKIEAIVNEKIRQNVPVVIKQMSKEE